MSFTMEFDMFVLRLEMEVISCEDETIGASQLSHHDFPSDRSEMKENEQVVTVTINSNDQEWSEFKFRHSSSSRIYIPSCC